MTYALRPLLTIPSMSRRQHGTKRIMRSVSVCQFSNCDEDAGQEMDGIALCALHHALLAGKPD